MTQTARPIRISDFTGGEASIFPITRMPPKYSELFQNCHVSERGTVAKIPGYIKVNTTAVAQSLTSGFEFRKTDGTIIILVAGGGKIYKKLITGELSEVHTGLDVNAKVYFIAMNNLCIICNGVNAPLKYDGTTVSALGGTPPSTSYKPHVHKGRVWMLERTNKMLASHSALNNPEDYTTVNDAGYIDFKYVLKTGDELVDIFTYIDLLVFVFRNHIVIYSGTTPSGASSNFVLTQLIEGSGAAGTDTTQGLGTDAVFAYIGGVKSLQQVVSTGNMTQGNVSKLVDPTLTKTIKTALTFASAHYAKYGWYLLMLGSTVYIYSYKWKAWGRITGADILGMFTTADDTLYFVGTGFLYQYDSGWDFAGTEPIMHWKTAWLPLSVKGNVEYPSILKMISNPADQTDVIISAAYNLNNVMPDNLQTVTINAENVTYIDSVSAWDSVDPLDEIQYTETRLPLFGSGICMQLGFKNTSSKQVEIADISIETEMGMGI